MINNAMYMIWQVMFMNGQQKRVAVPTFLVLTAEAVTSIPSTTRALVATLAHPTATAALGSAHFYFLALCSKVVN